MPPILQKMQTIAPVAPKRLARIAYYRLKNLQPTLRAAATWRGEKPRIYLHNTHTSPIFGTYITHPAMRYAPYPVAELCHWVGTVPRQSRLHKAHIFEVEHTLALFRDNRRFMQDWHRVISDGKFVNQLVARNQCRSVFTFSAGLMEHCKGFLRPELWPKLDYVYPAYPAQLEYEHPPDMPFTILVIASRFSDKGIPEALRAYEILRQRHGTAVRLLLVIPSQAMPAGYRLPDGVTHYDTPRMSEELKANLYRSADVLLIPCYSETAACFPEAYAFGVPVVTTRIHHGDEFVRDGVTGYLVDAPLFSYSEGFGSRWKTSDEFLADLAAMRERGELDKVVEQVVDRLETMIAGRTDLVTMRRAARAFHAQQFSPQVRNQKLLRIYAAALAH